MSKSRATPSAADTAVTTDGPGHRLAAERQARGIDIDRIAALLHLRRQVVEALEADRYDQLPDTVFVAGYYKNYARVLGIDGSSIVDDFRARVPDQDPSLTLTQPQPDQDPEAGSGRVLARVGAVVLFGAAIGLLALWWQGQVSTPASEQDTSQTAASGDQPAPAATGGAETSTTGPVTADQTTATTTAADAQPNGQPEPRTDSVSAAPTPPPATATAPATPPPATATSDAAAEEDFGSASTTTPPGGAGQVALEFTGASWVDVRGADGKLVLNGEMRAGDRRVLSGQPPFKLVIGNSAATRMTVDGQPFDLQSRARGNVARFTFDPSAPR